MHTLEDVRPIVVDQNTGRKHWSGQDSEFVGNYLRQEFEELEVSLQPDEEHLDRWEVCSELGDVGYLMIRLEEQMKKEEITEIPADILFFYKLANNVSASMNISFADAIYMKAVRNDLKYPFSVMNAFDDYEEARDTCKLMWARMGGDKAFYKWYEQVFGTI